MSPQTESNNLTRTNLLELLSRMRGQQEQQAEFADAPKFDWSCPHHFGPEAWSLLNNLGKKTAAQIERALRMLCQEKVRVSLKKIEQEFACALAERTAHQDPPMYFLPVLVASSEREGFVCINPQSSALLIGQALRDPEAGIDSSGNFSLLEKTILHDTVCSVFDSAALALEEHASLKLGRGEDIVSRDWPLSLHGMEDLCGFCFEAVWDEQRKAEFTLMLRAEVLEPALEHRPGVSKKLSPQETSRLILRRMEDVLVEVTTRICRASMPLEELMGLSAGDVLVLNKKTNEPVEVLLNGESCLKAWPAQTQNRWAIVVVQDRI